MCSYRALGTLNIDYIYLHLHHSRRETHKTPNKKAIYLDVNPRQTTAFLIAWFWGSTITSEAIALTLKALISIDILIDLLFIPVVS